MGRLNPTTPAGYTKIIFTGDVATSGSAASIHTALDGIDWVFLQNNDATNYISIGDAAGQTVRLVKAGGSITLPIRKIETIFAKAEANTPSLTILALGNAP